MRRAIRERNLTLDPPIAEWVYRAADFEVRGFEDALDGDGDQYSRPISETWNAGLPLTDGRLIVPRHLLTDEQLVSEGYEVLDRVHSPAPIPEMQTYGRGVVPRDRTQARAIHLARTKDGFIILGTGKGKTVVFLKAALEAGVPVLIYFDTMGLLQQWYEDARDLFGIPEHRLGKCLGPFERWEWRDRWVCFTSYQSFHQQLPRHVIPEEFYRYWGRVAWDEAHVSPSETRVPTLSLYPCARTGLTATIKRMGKETLMKWHVGPILVEDTSTDHIPNCFFRGIDLKRYKEFRKGKVSYVKMLGHCLGGRRGKGDVEYYSGVVDLIRDLRIQGRKCMVLFDRLRTGEAMRKEFGDEAVVVDQRTHYTKRPELLHSKDLVFFSSKIGEKGMNRKDLDTLVILFPMGSGEAGETRLFQSAGRVLRKDDGGAKDLTGTQVWVCYPKNEYGGELARNVEGMFRMRGWPVIDAAPCADEHAMQRLAVEHETALINPMMARRKKCSP